MPHRGKRLLRLRNGLDIIIPYRYKPFLGLLGIIGFRLDSL